MSDVPNGNGITQYCFVSEDVICHCQAHENAASESYYYLLLGQLVHSSCGGKDTKICKETTRKERMSLATNFIHKIGSGTFLKKRTCLLNKVGCEQCSFLSNRFFTCYHTFSTIMKARISFRFFFFRTRKTVPLIDVANFAMFPHFWTTYMKERFR